MKKKRLGEILREQGKISEEALQQAIQEQRLSFGLLGEILLQRELVAKDDLVSALEAMTHSPYVDCKEVAVDPEALSRIPESLASRFCALPVAIQGRRLVTVMSQPQDLAALNELRFLSGLEIEARLGLQQEILDAIQKHYRANRPEGAISAEPEESIEGVSLREIEFISVSNRQSNRDAMLEFQAELRKQPTQAVRLVSSILVTAASKEASDVHIEPQAFGTAVRIRVDGVLRELQRLPVSQQGTVISRIKILADLDIAERRVPQDGRFMVTVGERKLDVRVSTLPTQYGEKIVMRLLDSNSSLVSRQELDMPESAKSALDRILSMPQGMLLVTGPTGSGKSTTLYAALHQKHSPGINIVTVEDPVEYMIEGINQVQVNVKAGVTFATCLRSILRQDPNVIMVGEIRDRETAEIAMKASQTGHLVLSTLHTNDSVSAITRLLDLGAPGYMIASAMSGILAQRLVRRLCSCHRWKEPTGDFRAMLEAVGLRVGKQGMPVATGCPKCDDAGYRGRIGVFEILVFDDAIRSAVRGTARSDEISSLAKANGMRTIQIDALEKVRGGITTLEEVVRVVPFEVYNIAACTECRRELAPTFLFCPFCGTQRAAASPGTGPGTGQSQQPALADFGGVRK